MAKSRVTEEKQVVEKMIEVYCRGNHDQSKGLCDQCNELKEYACKRLDYCRYGEEKQFCSNCTTHCYQKEKKERIKEVMRFSGPRMLFYHPILAIKHLIGDMRTKGKVQ